MKTLTDFEIEMVSGGAEKKPPTPAPTPAPGSDPVGDFIRESVDWLINALETERKIVTNPPG